MDTSNGPLHISVTLDGVTPWLFIVLLVLGYFVIRDAVRMGIISAWRWRERQSEKAAARAAKSAPPPATRATAAPSSASAGSAPPASSGTPRKA